MTVEKNVETVAVACKDCGCIFSKRKSATKKVRCDAVLLAARDSGLLPDDFDVDADAERMARDTMGNGSNAGVKSLAAML